MGKTSKWRRLFILQQQQQQQQQPRQTSPASSPALSSPSSQPVVVTSVTEQSLANSLAKSTSSTMSTPSTLPTTTSPLLSTSGQWTWSSCQKRFIPLFTVLENCTKSIIFKYSFLHPKKFFWFLANSGYLKCIKRIAKNPEEFSRGKKSDTFFRWFSNTVAYSFIR